MSLQGQQVRFRVYSGVTINPPVPGIVSGTLLFDITSSTVYLDRDNERIQIQDNLKLSLTGGRLVGDIELFENGQVTTKLQTNGKVIGRYFQVTADIHFDESKNNVVVLDDEGNMGTRTLNELREDLGLVGWNDLKEENVVQSGVISGSFSNENLLLSFSPNSTAVLAKKN